MANTAWAQQSASQPTGSGQSANPRSDSAPKRSSPLPGELKPTLRINHLTIVEKARSHYFWTALELRVLAPDPSRGEGFWFASVNRGRSDGLSGFVGSLLPGKVRGEAEKGMEAALETTKSMLESDERSR